MSRKSFTPQDQQDLAEFLSHYEPNQRTFPSTHNEMAKQYTRHSAASWCTHYQKSGHEIVNRLIKQILIERGSREGSPQPTEEVDQLEESDNEESGEIGVVLASGSKRNAFTDEDDEEMLTALVKTHLQGRTIISAYQALVAKSNSHTVTSWQTRHRNERQWFDYKLAQRLKAHNLRKERKAEKERLAEKERVSTIVKAQKEQPKKDNGKGKGKGREIVAPVVSPRLESSPPPPDKSNVVARPPPFLPAKEVEPDVEDDEELDKLEGDQADDERPQQNQPNSIFTAADSEILVERLAFCELRDWSKAAMYEFLQQKHPQHTKEEWKSEHLKNRARYGTLAIEKSIELELAEAAITAQALLQEDQELEEGQERVEDESLQESPPTPKPTPPRAVSMPAGADEEEEVGEMDEVKTMSDLVDEDDLRIQAQLRINKPNQQDPSSSELDDDRIRSQSRPLLKLPPKEFDSPQEHDWEVSTVTQKLLLELSSTVQAMKGKEELIKQRFLKTEEIRKKKLAVAAKNAELERVRKVEAVRLEDVRSEAARQALLVAEEKERKRLELVESKRVEEERLAESKRAEKVIAAKKEKERKRLESERKALENLELERAEFEKAEEERLKLEEEEAKAERLKQEKEKLEQKMITAARLAKAQAITQAQQVFKNEASSSKAGSTVELVEEEKKKSSAKSLHSKASDPAIALPLIASSSKIISAPTVTSSKRSRRVEPELELENGEEKSPKKAKIDSTGKSIKPVKTIGLSEIFQRLSKEYKVTFKQVLNLYFACSAPVDTNILIKGLQYFSPSSNLSGSTELKRFAERRFWSYEEDVIVLSGTEEQKELLEKKKGRTSCEKRQNFLILSKRKEVGDLKRVWPFKK